MAQEPAPSGAECNRPKQERMHRLRPTREQTRFSSRRSPAQALSSATRVNEGASCSHRWRRSHRKSSSSSSSSPPPKGSSSSPSNRRWSGVPLLRMPACSRSLHVFQSIIFSYPIFAIFSAFLNRSSISFQSNSFIIP